ncbi:MAG: hypothetical protein NZ602_04245 [Thermoguttaceae bacterium]|nr:hypothetical protein [Thermoguttaceae bacterium]MDW8039209.1 hypothetical protein [Thermoguttaceae bacterium]
MNQPSMSKRLVVCAEVGQAGRTDWQTWIWAGLAASVFWAAMFRLEQAMGQAAGVTPVGSSAAPSAPADPNDQYLTELGALMDDLGCRQTYYPPMTAGRVGGWSPGPSTQIRDMSLREAIQTYRNEGRLQFEDFSKNADKTDDDAFGEYDPDARVVRINTSRRDAVLEGLCKIARSPKARWKGRINAYTQGLAAIQTFHHELVHLRQREHEGADPGSRKSEAIAYRSTWDLSQGWVHAFQQRLEKEPTLDLAIRLQAACTAWKEYKVSIENAIQTSPSPPDRSVFAEPFLDPSGKKFSLDSMLQEIEKIQQEAQKIERVFRLLGGLQGQGGAYGPQADDIVGWDQLRERLDHAGPLDSKADLEAFLKQAARKAAANEPSLKGLSPDEIFANVQPTVAQLWREKHRRSFPATLHELGRQQPQLDAALDPKEGFRGGPGKVDKVTVTLRTTDSLPKAIDRVRKLAEDIFDPPDRPTISVKDRWTGPDGVVETEDWSADPPEQQYQLEKPGNYAVQLQRTVYVGGKEFIAYPAIKIPFTVPANTPENVAGRWIGSLVIKEFIVSAENQPPQRCQQLDGAQFQVIMDLTPTGPTAGQLVVELTPEKMPEGVKAKKTGPTAGSYTLSGLRFLGQMNLQGRKWPLEGDFEFTNNRWTIRGVSSASAPLGEGRATVKYSWSVSQAGPPRTKK